MLDCDPAFGYGRQRGTWRHTGSGYGGAECAAADHEPIRLTTDLNLGFEGPRAVARHRLHAGDQRFCAMSWGDASPPPDIAEARRRMEQTAAFFLSAAGRKKRAGDGSPVSDEARVPIAGNPKIWNPNRRVSLMTKIVKKGHPYRGWAGRRRSRSASSPSSWA